MRKLNLLNLIFLLTACTALTPSPAPTATALPTATPTATPAPTPTPTPIPTLPAEQISGLQGVPARPLRRKR